MSHWMLVGLVGWACVLYLGMRRHRHPRDISESALPRVSILVSARNEERDLPRCIESLLALDYPTEKLEIILVDDRSTDQTGDIIRKVAQEYDHVQSYDTKGFVTHLRAKARGIARAAQVATGKWLFVTDADAAVPRLWLRQMLGMANEDTGLLCGIFAIPEPRSLLAHCEGVISLGGQAFLYGTAGYTGAAPPSGPNMAIRRDVYETGGGLEGIGFHIAEDMALWRLSERAGAKVASCFEPNAMVSVTPVPSWYHLVSQTRRWFQGGVRDSPFRVRIATMGLGLYAFVANLGIMLGWLMNIQAWLIVIGLKLTADVLLMSGMARRLQLKDAILRAVVLTIYGTFAFFWVPLTAILASKVRWRGEGYVTGGQTRAVHRRSPQLRSKTA